MHIVMENLTVVQSEIIPTPVTDNLTTKLTTASVEIRDADYYWNSLLDKDDSQPQPCSLNQPHSHQNANGIIVLLDIFSTFVVAAIAVSAPYLFNKKIRPFASWLNCAGAGILLGTCFFHYMPEVREEFAKLKLFENHNLLNIQLEIFTVNGFLLMLLLEQFVATYCTRFFSEAGVHSHCHPPNLKDNSSSNSESSQKSSEQHELIVQKTDPHQEHCHEDVAQHSALRSLAFVGSLLVHSVCEGFNLVMLPLHTDDKEKAWKKNTPLLISICLHKLAVGLTMGFNLKSSKLKTTHAKRALFAWTLFTPFGGLLAYFTKNVLPITLIAPLNAIGLGTFFYVLFFEIAPHEFLGSGEKKFLKALVLIGGTGLALILNASMPHSHEHSHHDHGHGHSH